MTIDSFFTNIEEHYAQQLPFVLYSRPIDSIIKCWLQRDAKLHLTEKFSESGFVFAPFNLDDKSVLFEASNCDYHTLEIENLNLEKEINKTEFQKHDKSKHIKLVSNAINAIVKGELNKVVVSRVEKNSFYSNHPLDIFKRLFNTYKNAMVYCWYHPKVGLWLGATPELLFKLEGRRLTTISLAGTQPFTNQSEIHWKEKEREEQQIVTDYITKQIIPFTDKVKIEETKTAKAGDLAHLKTRILSVLKPDTNLENIITAMHPTPAVCGFPKETAKDFILKNENYEREFYTGFLGELNLKLTKTRNTNRRNIENFAYATVKKQSNFYVNLRCVQLKDNEAHIYVGGGITADSDPEKEWEETVNKSATIKNILY